MHHWTGERRTIKKKAAAILADHDGQMSETQTTK